MEYRQGKKRVNTIIQTYLHNTKCGDSRICEGMEYTLNGGKRLRSVLTLAVLEKLLPDSWTDFEQVCLVPEFIHSSSLIIDDLPAFDNALTRRDQKCIHLVKGEGLAYLLSFNLVTEAMVVIHNQLPHLKKAYSTEEAYCQYQELIHNIITNISTKRALGGQLLSTFHTSGNINLRDMKNNKPPILSHKEICDVIYKKTSSFFEIALVVGWIFGRGDINKLKAIQDLSDLLGLCYQIYDDFVDYHEDISNSDHFSHNYVYHRGIEISYTEYKDYQKELCKKITALGLDCPTFNYVCNFMNKKVLEAKNSLKVNADQV